MDINSAVAALAAALFSTDEFKRLREIRAQINKNASLQARLKNFEDNRNKLNETDPAKAVSSQAMRVIQDEYLALNNIPEINAYFNADYAFANILNGAIQRLHELIYRSIIQ